MDILAEIKQAASKGIREYLRSTRGAAACGPHAKVEDGKKGDLKITKSNGDQIIVSFMEL